MIPADLQCQIQRMLDGELCSDEVAELEADLLHSEESLETFKKMAWLHSDLEVLHTAEAVVGKAKIVPIERVITRQRRRNLKIITSAVAAVFAISLLVLSLIQAPEEPIATFSTTPVADFTLTHLELDRGQLSEQILNAGTTLHLRSGSLEGSFRSGVRFLAEAPCELEVIDDGTVALKQGVAWFEVSPNATGFTVECENLTIVDLGTKFGVHAASGLYTEVHVTRGLVELTSRHKDRLKRTLRAGEAIRFNQDNSLVEIKVNDDKFTKQLESANGLIGHWEFETESNSKTPDSSGNGHIGRLIGAATIGNDPQRGSVLLLPKSRSNHGMVDIDAIKPIPNLHQHRGYTLAAWIKPNLQAMPNSTYAYAIGLGEEGKNPIATLGLSKNHIRSFIEGDNGVQIRVTSSTTTASHEIWIHITITCDRAGNTAQLYVNGNPVSVPTDISRIGDGELDWGFAKIGRTLGKGHIQHFIGMIDDVRIYDRPLNAEEVSKLAH